MSMNKSLRILFLCTGNSCRSQMAEGFLKAIDASLEVHSAGTHPAERVHPKAIQVMKEVGIDLSENQPKQVDRFLRDRFDYVITVCDNARCPNRMECYSQKTATFMILGNICTRACGFCSVPRGTPEPPAAAPPRPVRPAETLASVMCRV